MGKYLRETLKMLQAEPCEDAISRADAIRVASGYCHPANIAGELAKLPPVKPTRKKGKWIKSNIGGAKVCSICQAHMGLSNFNYCPNCGAKMGSEEE